MPPFSDADMPQFAEPLRMGGAMPYSEPPPYPEDAADAQAYPEGMPQFAAPLRIGGASPYSAPPAYSEEPAMAAYPEPASEVSDVPPYSEPRGLQPFVTPAGEPTETAPPSPPPLFHSGSEAQTAAAPMFDAAAKIAAEASATAEALENLNRLLVQDVPDADATQPRSLRHGPAQMHFRQDPAPFAPRPPALLMPLPVPPHQERSKSIYLLGFLTGLGLSLMAGIALYVLINIG
jgi:hypothetical protein